ncbi:MAG: NosD domain-containing protein [Methanomicrobiales archaeon]|nr:NosD domain-containing protein [Methanomicrobiales archaeon]
MQRQMRRVRSRTYTRCSIAILVCIAILLLPSISDAAILTVSPGRSIQRAINNATDGDTIEVNSGTYFENLVLNRSVTLRGIGNPIIDGRLRIGQNTILVTANGALIEGFRVRNATEAGVNVSADDVVIRGCEAVENYRFGIVVHRAKNTTISNTSCDLNAYPGYGGYGRGVYLRGANSTTIEGLNATRNNVSGVHIDGSSGTLLRWGTIIRSGTCGVDVQRSSDTRIVGLLVQSTGEREGYGIRARDSGNITIESCTLNDTFWAGAHLENVSGASLQGNTISQTRFHLGYGIYLEHSNDVCISGNYLTDSGYGIWVNASGSASPIRIFLNSFIRDTTAARSASSIASWVSPELEYGYLGGVYTNTTGNYWDAFASTDSDGDGILDMPYEDVEILDPHPLAGPHPLYLVPPPPDTIPPSGVVNLTNATYEATSIRWIWEDPPDADLSHVEIYLDGSLRGTVEREKMSFRADGLEPARAYELGTRTVDLKGNVNASWVNHTAMTAEAAVPETTPSCTPTITPEGTPIPEPSPSPSPEPTPSPLLDDNVPPRCPAGVHVTMASSGSFTLAWADPPDTDLSHLIVYLDGQRSGEANIGTEAWTFPGLQPGVSYHVRLTPVDLAGNANESCAAYVVRTHDAEGWPSSSDGGGDETHLAPAATVTPLLSPAAAPSTTGPSATQTPVPVSTAYRGGDQSGGCEAAEICITDGNAEEIAPLEAPMPEQEGQTSHARFILPSIGVAMLAGGGYLLYRRGKN